MTDYLPWTPRDAADWIAVPADDDDKYSRGVLGVVTGSDQYPGAAVLGVEAALHTGVGMLRYLGPERAASFVLHRRPEAVTSPGRVQAWLLGSGIDPATLDGVTTDRFQVAAESGLPLVLDAGALSLREQTSAPIVLTPHFRELAKASGPEVDEIAAGSWAPLWPLTPRRSQPTRMPWLAWPRRRAWCTGWLPPALRVVGR
jgi:NAD(P)H-hydrate repair Nnr-like enzyme with NAD(P)H-hydrate dehydratase domain